MWCRNGFPDLYISLDFYISLYIPRLSWPSHFSLWRLRFTRAEHQLFKWMADFQKTGTLLLFYYNSLFFPSLLPSFPSFHTEQMRGRFCGTNVCTQQRKADEHHADDCIHLRRELCWPGLCSIHVPIHVVTVHSMKNMCGVMLFSSN